MRVRGGVRRQAYTGAMTEKMRLSHSQTGSLLGCSLSWYINRRARMPGLTYFSTLAGSVAHERIEHYLLHGEWPAETITEHLDRLIEAELWDTPYLLEDIRTSKLPAGLKVTDYPDGFNREAVIAILPAWIHKWVTYYESLKADGWVLWTLPDGTPGTEVEVRTTLAGHPVIGSVDAVMVHTVTEELMGLDWKFGRSAPKDTSQLDLYRIAFYDTFGKELKRCAYYMGRTGKEHAAADLPTFTREMLEVKFREAGERATRAEAGEFHIDLTACNYLCNVRAFCERREGPFSNLVALPTPTVRPNNN